MLNVKGDVSDIKFIQLFHQICRKSHHFQRHFLNIYVGYLQNSIHIKLPIACLKQVN